MKTKLPRMMFCLMILLCACTAWADEGDSGSAFDWTLLVGLGVAAVTAGWQAFKALKWTTLSKKQRLVGRIIELAAQGAYVLYTRKAKKAAPDGKLTKDQRMTAMQTAKDLARSDAKMQGLEDAPEIKDDRMLEAALELEVTKAKAVAGAAPRHRGTGLPR